MSATQLVYGRHAVAQMLQANPKSVRRVLLHAQSATRCSQIEQLAAVSKVPVLTLTKQQIAKLAKDAVHQGVVAEIEAFEYADLDDVVACARAAGEPALVVVCDSLQDPHNLGAILRSAYALGAHGVVIPKDRACEVTPAVMKAAAGAASRLPVARVTNIKRALADLKHAGLWVVGAAGDAAQALPTIDLKMPVALVVGSEGSGMRQQVQAACDFVAAIPMQGELGSLNVSVATAIALYEIGRQRRSAVQPLPNSP